jgi:hypothetical protein
MGYPRKLRDWQVYREPNPEVDPSTGQPIASYRPPDQAFTEALGYGSPYYTIASDQYDPVQHLPTDLFSTPHDPIGLTAYNQQKYRATSDIYNQLIPSSQNLRNRTLKDIIQQQQMPMEQLYASQQMGENVSQNAQRQDQIRATMAGRGLGQSGIMDEGTLANQSQYLKDYQKAQLNAKNQEVARQGGLAAGMTDIVNKDLDFYRLINAGLNEARGLISPANLGALEGLGRGASGLVTALFGEGFKSPAEQISTSGLPDYSALGYSNGGYTNLGGNDVEDIYGTRFGT